MAYAIFKRHVHMGLADTVAKGLKSRTLEVSAAVFGGTGTVFATPLELVEAYGNISRCVPLRYNTYELQADGALSADTDSDARDETKLSFIMDDGGTRSIKILNPRQEIFVTPSGAGSNIVKDKATLDAAAAGTPENDLARFIDALLGGEVFMDDGETPSQYVGGEKN